MTDHFRPVALEHASRLINHGPTVLVTSVAAAADERVFVGGHWSVRDDNMPLHTIHHLGGGNFACAGNVLRAKAA